MTPAQHLGIEPLPPEQTGPVLAVKAGLATVELAHYCAQAIPAGTLYRYNNNYGTISPDGEFSPITPKKFCTWIAQYVYFHRQKNHQPSEKTSERSADSTLEDLFGEQRSLSEATSAIILASEQMESISPVIERIEKIRLPRKIKTKEGRTKYEPAPVGYDPKTKTFTVDGLPIDWNKMYSVDRCRKVLARVFRDFPFDGGELPTEDSRSMAATVTALLGVFLHNNFDKYPLVSVNANQPGTGKSFMVQCLLAPVHGLPAATNYSQDANEMRKTLNALAMSRAPYCFLDDISVLISNELNRFITNKTINDRIITTGETFTIENNMQFFVTGNGIKMKTDMERRMLNIDLFFDGDATKRKHAGGLSDEIISSDAWRRDMLQTLWSLVAGYCHAGCPRTDITAPVAFPEYAFCAHIARWAGFADPYGPRTINLDDGDQQAANMTRLLVLIADKIGYEYWKDLTPVPPAKMPGLSVSLTTSDIVDIAREADLLEVILSGKQINTPSVSIGHVLRAFRGRRLTDSYGRDFVLGDRKRAATSRYPITILTAPVRAEPVSEP